MNLTQKAYARKRVDQIERDKLAAIKQETFEKPGKQHNATKRLSLFKKGEFKLNPDIYDSGMNPFVDKKYTYFKDALVFTGEERPIFDQKAFGAARKKIMDRANQIRDQIMLGDAEQGLKLIEKFEEE